MLDWSSRMMIWIGRPRTPPLAFSSFSASRAAIWMPLPSSALGPVRAATRPILIGSLDSDPPDCEAVWEPVDGFWELVPPLPDCEVHAASRAMDRTRNRATNLFMRTPASYFTYSWFM